MPRYVAFFGSINVGGNRITMADLRWALEREEFEGVETVVASGNVLFDHAGEVAEAINGNPFAAGGDAARVHTLFQSGQASGEAFAKMEADWATRGPERLALGPRSVYIDYVNGVGGSSLSNAFIERRLGMRGTARNIRSLQRILAKLAQG